MTLIAVATAGAAAATWDVDKLPDPSVRVSLYGVSCPTGGLCVAVGGNGTIATSTNPAAGGGSWSVGRPTGSVVPPDVPGLPTTGNATFGGAQIRSVSCPSASLCVAASFDGIIYFSQNPAGGAGTWSAIPLSEPKTPNHHMGGVSCPAADFCVAVAYGGKILVTGYPTGGRAGWVLTQLPLPYDLRGVACPTTSFCVAAGNEGEVLVSSNPAGGVWEAAGRPLGFHSINGVSCPTTDLCVIGSAGGVAVSTDPRRGPGAWRVVSAGTGLPIKAVSCPTTAACAAIDNNADFLVSTDPTAGPGAWSFENVVSFRSRAPGLGNGMFGLSCPSTDLCVGVGQDSQVLTTTDPFARPAGAAGKGRQKRRRGRRPRVRITRHPAKRLDHRKGGVRVTFRFRAVRKTVRFKCGTRGKRKRGRKRGRTRGRRCRPLVRFKCRTRRGRYRRCRSPVRYPVGRGKHAFRVRAISRRGVKGPPTTFHFRVGGLSEPPPYGSCPPGARPRAAPCIPNRG